MKLLVASEDADRAIRELGECFDAAMKDGRPENVAQFRLALETLRRAIRSTKEPEPEAGAAAVRVLLARAADALDCDVASPDDLAPETLVKELRAAAGHSAVNRERTFPSAAVRGTVLCHTAAGGMIIDSAAPAYPEGSKVVVVLLGKAQ